jgi:hypothetical protein
MASLASSYSLPLIVPMMDGVVMTLRITLLTRCDDIAEDGLAPVDQPDHVIRGTIPRMVPGPR